jgi:rhodanese-related sulfurtransferase
VRPEDGTRGAATISLRRQHSGVVAAAGSTVCGPAPARIVLCIAMVLAVESCNDGAATKGRGAPGERSVARDRTCFVSAADLPDWRRAQDLVIVDTRSEDDFRRLRIPGSINVRPNVLRTKAYLKAKRLLLVSGGGSGVELEGVCMGLRESGFATVGILEGGLTSWVRHAGRLEGDQLAARALNRLSPAQLAQEARSDRWVFLDVSPGGSPNSDPFVPGALRAPAATGVALRRAVDGGLRQKGGNRSSTFVLVADARGEGYDQIAAHLEPLDLTHLYFLDGGVNGFRAFRAQQTQIAISAAQGCISDRCAGR